MPVLVVVMPVLVVVMPVFVAVVPVTGGTTFLGLDSLLLRAGLLEKFVLLVSSSVAVRLTAEDKA